MTRGPALHLLLPHRALSAVLGLLCLTAPVRADKFTPGPVELFVDPQLLGGAEVTLESCANEDCTQWDSAERQSGAGPCPAWHSFTPAHRKGRHRVVVRAAGQVRQRNLPDRPRDAVFLIGVAGDELTVKSWNGPQLPLCSQEWRPPLFSNAWLRHVLAKNTPGTGSAPGESPGSSSLVFWRMALDLLLSLVVEALAGGVVLLLLRKPLRLLLPAALATCMTLPVLHGLMEGLPLPTMAMWPLELLVVATEAWMVWRLAGNHIRFKAALVWCGITNACSFLVGYWL